MSDWKYVGSTAAAKLVALVKAALNSKADKTNATKSVAGLMSAADKAKLDRIEDGANKTIVDAELDAASANPVQNKAVKVALDGKAGTAVATTSANGLMSATDKTKLDGVEDGATKTIVDDAISDTSTNPVQNKAVKAALDGKLSTRGGEISASLEVGQTVSAGGSVSVGRTSSDTGIHFEKAASDAGRISHGSDPMTGVAPIARLKVASPTEDDDAATKKYVDDRAVRYDAAQTLDEAQQFQARKNIGAIGHNSPQFQGFLALAPANEPLGTGVGLSPTIDGNNYALDISDVNEGNPTLLTGVKTPTDADTDAAATVEYVKAKAAVTAANVAAAMGLSGLAANDQIMVSAVDTNGKLTSWKKKWKDVFNIQDLGAKGDGATDDTAVFQTALSKYRRVFVPGGVYVLSDALTIGDACELELSADTVFDFKQLDGNCISMKMSACLRGNHAALRVPYAFAGNVINIASSLDSSVTDVPPYTKWDPQWKTGRYVTDVCVTKPDSRGFHYSVDGTCSGTAIYIEADSGATSTFIWGLSASGIRIAGAFAYGIHAKMVGTGWCHEARIEAFIDACEIGVCMEDCNNTYVSATIQPRAALTSSGTNVAYAKYGIELIRSRNTDLSGSRVWDWNSANSLWTGDTDSGCVYQHIAMIGNCSGTILNDFFYYEMPAYDIRKLIYTDTVSNLEKINILQEPFTRWFKPIGGAPMFYTGAENKELLLKEDYNSTFQTVLVPRFTNRLLTAAEADGSIFGGKGYQVGKMWRTDGVTLSDDPGLLCTGFIPCSGGAIIRFKGISFTPGDNNCRVILYKSDHSKLMHVNRGNLVTNASSYFINGYEETENGCQFTVVSSEAAYFKVNVYASTNDGNPIVTVNEALAYEQIGTLASGIKVDYAQIINAPDFLTIGDLPRYDGSVS